MIPTPLYELLPYLYVFSGILAIVGLDPILTDICGLLLITVGVIVHQTRRHCRHRKIQSTDVAETKARNSSHAQSGVSRRNTADPISLSSARMSLVGQDFEQGATGEEYGAYQEALQWYRKAADQGYAPAQFNLGVMYLAGQGGIAKDYMATYVWFSLAAVQGDEDARQAQQKIVTRLTAEQQAQAQQWLLAKMPDRNSRRSQRG